MSKYWVKRQEQREDLSFQKGSKEVKEYIKVLENAKQGINDKIAGLYAKYGQDSGLPRMEAMRVIKGDEYKEWRFKIEDYVKQLNSIKDKNSVEFKKLSLELETLAYRSRINRLTSLKADIDMELIKAGDKAVKSMTNTLTSTYSDTYKTLVDDLKFKSHVDMDRVKKVLGYDWSGSNYSDRIWSNTEALAKTIKNEVLMGINQGINYKTMSTRIADKFNTAYKNAERLVRTEVNYIHNQATADSYKDAGIEKYQFVATLDHRTSETCAGLNGEVFELKDIAVGINYPPMHPRCFDKNTEVYTNYGWILFKNLTGEELVYTINPKNLEPEWQQPINYISYHYQGNMISFKNSRFDLLVTPNHSVLVQNMDSSVKDKSWKLKCADEVGRKSKHRFLSGLNWNGIYRDYEILAGEKVDIETYLKFMAYWLSDGSCTPRKNNYNIKIAQHNNEWMYEELKKLPFKIYKCKESLMIRNKELGEELKQYGKCTEKYIPDNIKNMSPDLIRIFLLAYSKTDGTLRKGKFWKGYKFNDSISFFTSSDRIASDLGELILKAGGRPSYYLNECGGKEKKFKNGIYTINKDVWVINWNTHLYNYLYNMEIKDIEYNDYVYCVEVPKYHTLLVRRNGKICWSGNCRSTTIPIIDYTSLQNIKEDDEKTLKNNEESSKIEEKEPEIKKNYKILDKRKIDDIQADSDIVFKNLNNEVKGSLRDYTTGGFTDINRYLNGEKDYNRQIDVENIHKAMDTFELKDDTVVFRGTYVRYYEKYQQGDVFKGNIFYSTSVYEDKAQGFYDDIRYYDEEDTNAVLLEIKVPKNTKSLYIGNNTSFDEPEGELLLSNELSYKLLERKDNKIILEVVTIDE